MVCTSNYLVQEEEKTSGFNAVMRLASYLVQLDTASYITDRQASKIVQLWNGLDDNDKRRVKYMPRFHEKLVTGRFPRAKGRKFIPGIESVRRSYVGHGLPAQRPSVSPIVDAVCSELVLKYRRSTTLRTAKGRLLVPKWQKVMDGYSRIKHLVDGCATIQTNTSLQLFHINMHTLRQW